MLNHVNANMRYDFERPAQTRANIPMARPRSSAATSQTSSCYATSPRLSERAK
nr:hypothetical protein Iba_chr10cCG4490 [Ipomoea batatas]